MKIATIENSINRDAVPKQVNVTNVFDQIIKFGDDNLAPQLFMSLARSVPNHRAILNSKLRYVNAELISEDSNTLEFIKNINIENQSLNTILGRIEFDFLSTGNCYTEIITDARVSFLNFGHLDSTKGRLHRDMDKVILNPNWANRNTNNDVILPIYPDFVADGNLRRSVMWVKDYEPEFINGLPGWYAGLRQASISGLIDISNEAELKNGHSISGMLFVPGVESGEDLEVIETQVNKDKTGANNAGKLFVSTLQNGEGNQRPELIDFRKQIDGNFIDLKTMTNDQLLMVHSWYRSLAGFQDNTGFDTNRIINEYRVALPSYIKPTQDIFLSEFNKVLNRFGYKDITANNKSPINAIQDEDLKFIWEMRRDRGMDFDPKDIAQQKLIYEVKK